MSDRPDYTRPVSIEAITIASLPIDIVAQTVGNVEVNVQTAGGTNILIDLLTREHTAPVRGYIQNDGETPPHHIATNSTNPRAKLFARGIRGSITIAKVHAKNTDAVNPHNMTVSVSPDLATWTDLATVTVPAGWEGWIAKPFTAVVWRHDMAYVRTLSDHADCLIGYDNTEPFDSYVQAAGNWMAWPTRIYVRLSVDATDSLPVGGIIDVDIIAQTIGNIAIDIAAQTVGNLTIDITAQSLPWININITKATATVNINIASQDANVDVNIAASAVTINVDVQNAYLYVRTEAAQNLNVDIAAQTVGNLNINIAASAISLNVKTTGAEKVAVDIAAQTVGNVAIDIAAQTVGNINVNIAAQAANVNVDIAAQTVDLNIKTSGGANIIIDKLTQTAYTERRSTISNSDTAAGWSAPTGNNRRGKFFPRGCRGFIDTIDVYCKDAGAAGGTISVYITPHPSMGYIATADVTVPAGGGEDWRSANFDRMWNYDSLFIFAVSSSADIQWAYDATEPYDYYFSSDAGASWVHGNFREFFRVIMKGETVGDVPVSGTINTIEIPSVGSKRSEDDVNVADGVITSVVTLTGSGTVLELRLIFLDDTVPAGLVTYELIAYADGVLSYEISNRDLTQSLNATSGRCCIGEFWQTAAPETHMNVRLPIKFKRQLELRARQTTGAAVNTHGRIYANLTS